MKLKESLCKAGFEYADADERPGHLCCSCKRDFAIGYSMGFDKARELIKHEFMRSDSISVERIMAVGEEEVE